MCGGGGGGGGGGGDFRLALSAKMQHIDVNVSVLLLVSFSSHTEDRKQKTHKTYHIPCFFLKVTPLLSSWENACGKFTTRCISLRLQARFYSLYRRFESIRNINHVGKTWPELMQGK